MDRFHEFKEKYDEYERLKQEFYRDDDRVFRQLPILYDKWPVLNRRSKTSNMPKKDESEDFLLRVDAWLITSRLGMYHNFLGKAYDSISDILAWSAETEIEKDRRKEALLDFFAVISMLESQISRAQKCLAFLREVGFPASIFGAPE